jgi:hypothetical protein
MKTAMPKLVLRIYAPPAATTAPHTNTAPVQDAGKEKHRREAEEQGGDDGHDTLPVLWIFAGIMCPVIVSL